MYDLIGDIHGYASELKALLAKMGYQVTDGIWQHPERKVIFLSDFVDRGPEQIETVHIARTMVESGNALAIKGDHEYSAVAWAKPDPQNPEQYPRRTCKNWSQHKAFLGKVGEGSEPHNSMIKWFKTPPVYLDLPKLRAVHACWHPKYVNMIDQFTDDDNRLLAHAWEASGRKGSEAYDSIEHLLKGLEFALPDGRHFFYKTRDASEHKEKRTEVRAKWWLTDCFTLRELAIVPDSEVEKIPHDLVDKTRLPSFDGEKPVFVGEARLKKENFVF
ncbi:MAG: hypothetical protein ACI912_000457 [Marinobacter psychrophilus]|jgi:hypothetical protein